MSAHSGVLASLKEYQQLAAGALTFLGVLLGFGVTAILQFLTDRRKHLYDRRLATWKADQELTLVRASLRAELTRICKVILGQRDHVAAGNHFMWVPVFGTGLPTRENIARTQVLTAAEIGAVTAFQYSYQEHLGYLAGAAEKDLRPEIDLAFNAIGYNYSEPRRLEWLLWSLGVIERKALRALDALDGTTAGVQAAALPPWMPLDGPAAPPKKAEIEVRPIHGGGWTLRGGRRFELPAPFVLASPTPARRGLAGRVGDRHELAGTWLLLRPSADPALPAGTVRVDGVRDGVAGYAVMRAVPWI